MESLECAEFDQLRNAAERPMGYVQEWKQRSAGKAIGSFPMNFPSEIIHATGALPVIVQESRSPITEGRSLLPEFYCGYTRSIADQISVGELEALDGFVLVDHCVQLLGAVDVIRWARPDKPVGFAQFISSMDDPWSPGQVRDKISSICQELEEITGVGVETSALTRSIGLYNANRALLREFYELRSAGKLNVPAAQLQVLVKSSMIMDIEEHTALLRILRDRLETRIQSPDSAIRLHLSGHYCAAPRPELLELIEECDVVVINDDLYHGNRYISTDVPRGEDPFTALAAWYLERNVKAPCGTRVQLNVDWQSYLVDSLRETGAEGVITLMAKFCEPLMLYYPELRKTLAEQDIPELLIETEHDGLPAESIRTTVETFVERIRRQRTRILSHV